MSDSRVLTRFSVLPDRAAIRSKAHGTFQSVRESPNYRRYISGQVISMAGTWMQTVALGWLVLQLTHSGTALGLVYACQFLPVLVFAPWGGVIVDRLDTRRLLVCTQAVAGILALALGVLTVTNVVQLWMVYVLAILLGIVTAVDNPARQTFVLELVGPETLSNAITLNSVAINLARIVGPAIAGLVIALVGIGPCFIINGGSFAAVIVALMLIDRRELHPRTVVPRAKGQVREGLRYVWSVPALRGPLVLMAVVGTFTYEFQVTLPLVAKYTFDGSALMLSLFTGAMGVGAVVGGLVTASRSRSGIGPLIRVTLALGVLVTLVALAPTPVVAAVLLVFAGVASISFLAVGNTTLQLAADPGMRGRVMAIWTMALLGSTPIGGLFVGWIGQWAGARWSLAVGGVAAVLASGYAWREQRIATREGGPTVTAPEPGPAALVN